MQGKGKGQCNGLRDAIGPGNTNGTCPLGNTPQQRDAWQ